MKAGALEAITRLQALKSLSTYSPTLSDWIDESIAAIQKADDQEKRDYLSSNTIYKAATETLQVQVADLEARLKDATAQKPETPTDASLYPATGTTEVSASGLEPLP